MKILFESELVKLLLTGQDYDFIAVIENKTGKEICAIDEKDMEEELFSIKAHGWTGILADEEGYETIDKIKDGLISFSERIDLMANTPCSQLAETTDGKSYLYHNRCRTCQRFMNRRCSYI